MCDAYSYCYGVALATYSYSWLATCFIVITIYYIGESAVSDTEEVWDDSDNSDNVDEDTCTVTEHCSALKLSQEKCAPHERESITALLYWIIGFIINFQARYYIPDTAINVLIKFLLVFLKVLGRFSPFVGNVVKNFPTSYHEMLKKCDGNNCKSFIKFVVCQKCHKLYYFDQCITVTGSQSTSKTCSYVAFPNHPQTSRRKQCGCLLLKSVERKSKRFLYPFKVYCYKSLQESLQTLFLRKKFVSDCGIWKKESQSTPELQGTIKDIYDGNIWKEFQIYKGIAFLNQPYSLGLILNVDWFQPFSHTQYSVGVIYLTVLNLPRHIRYKRDNVILIGIIPGPREPEHTINTYLQPLIKELKQFWKGIKLSILTENGVEEKTIRAALMCVSCDLPAGHKTCGFLGHSATLGCSKCLKEFPGEIGNKDYSGFNRSGWEKRDDKTHRDAVKKIKECVTKTSMAKAESSAGCRFSSLLELPYFDAPRMLCIDPMHNLFLGTSKRMITLWIDHSLVTKSHFCSIQEFINQIIVPPDIGRIPHKIESGFSSFKADQFKTCMGKCLFDTSSV